MRTQVPSPKGAQPPIFGPYLLWPNGSMDQDATWYGDRPRPKRHCVRWGPSSPSLQKGAEPPIFGPYLLWPNSCMDQDATWYRGRPRPRLHCAIWGPSSPPQKRGHSHPQFLAHVCCSQTAGWIKMPLYTMVGLGLGNIVLDADPAPSPRGTAPRKFLFMSVVAKQLDGSGCHLIWR